MSAANRNPERWEELVADDALVGLSPEERAEFATLVDAEVVLAETPFFEHAAGEIAAAAFAAQDDKERMPAALEARVLARIAGILPRVSTKPSPTDNAIRLPVSSPQTRRSRAIPWLLAAAAIVIAIVGWTRAPRVVTRVPEAPSAERERAELLAIAGTIKSDFSHTNDPSAKNATGDVLWHSGRQRGFMRIQGLAPNNRATEQYQLWIFDTERDDAYPVDGGVFDVTPNERGEVIIPIEAKLPVRKAKLFAITVEKPGGVVVSKRERIVLTASSTSS